MESYNYYEIDNNKCYDGSYISNENTSKFI